MPGLQTVVRCRQGTSLLLGVLVATVLTGQLFADFATPFVETNNQVGDRSRAHGYVVSLGSARGEGPTHFIVIVGTDTEEFVIVRAAAKAGGEKRGQKKGTFYFFVAVARCLASPSRPPCRLFAGKNQNVPFSRRQELECRLFPDTLSALQDKSACTVITDFASGGTCGGRHGGWGMVTLSVAFASTLPANLGGREWPHGI